MLPREEEPGAKDLLEISNGERLKLTDRIHRTCPGSSWGEDNRGCGSFCREKACCFAGDGREEVYLAVAGADDWRHSSAMPLVH